MNARSTLLAGLAFALLALPLRAQEETPACHDGHAGAGSAPAAHQDDSGDQSAAVLDLEPRGLDPLGLDVELLDQDGKSVRFYTDLLKDKVVAMNFVFTTCTTVCPPMGASFGRLQKELGERYGRDVYLISVSVDPVTDTPQRLKAWSQQFDAGDGWTLVTGPKAQVNQVLKALKVFTPDSKDHAPLVLLGNDRTGIWQKAHGFTPPAKLASLLVGFLEEGQASTGEAVAGVEKEADDPAAQTALATETVL